MYWIATLFKNDVYILTFRNETAKHTVVTFNRFFVKRKIRGGKIHLGFSVF